MSRTCTLFDWAELRRSDCARGPPQITEVELFVAALGASNYTFAEATHTQQVLAHEPVGAGEELLCGERRRRMSPS